MVMVARRLCQSMLMTGLACLLAGCGGNIRGYHQGSTGADTEGERRLIFEAESFETALRRSGQLYGDAALDAYLQSIMDRLYPDHPGLIKVRVLRAPVVNAFALPNGGVYINTGLLAVLENEAQLATVLAHEGAHVLEKHGAKQREVSITAAGAATAVSLMGVPLVGQLAAMGSISGYSRGYEESADGEGFRRLLVAGYAPEQSLAAFQALEREAQADGNEDAPFFFSSHPRIRERIASYSRLMQSVQGGRVGREEYVKHVAVARVAFIQDKLAAGQHAEVVNHLSWRLKNSAETPPEDLALLGEAHRLIGGEKSLKEGLTYVTRALAQTPEHGPALRTAGLIHYKLGHKAEARKMLSGYLRVAPSATDGPFIREYIARLEP